MMEQNMETTTLLSLEGLGLQGPSNDERENGNYLSAQGVGFKIKV